MEAIELEVEARDLLGSSNAGRIRREGKIPAVVYSHGSEAQALTVNAHAFSQIMARASRSQLFSLKSSEKTLNGSWALLKEISIEPLKDQVLHIDLLAVKEGEQIVVTVPLEMTGESAPVKAGEALLNQVISEVKIKCVVTAIPRSLIMDISTLDKGHSLHVSDIQVPAGVVILADAADTVVTIIERAEEEAASVVAAVATPDAAAAAGAAPTGDAAAAAADKGGKAEKKAEKK